MMERSARRINAPAFLSFPGVQAWIKDRAEMTIVASIKTKAMQQLPVPLPSIEEQRRMGDLLCALDSQIEAHHQVVAGGGTRARRTRDPADGECSLVR
ncbi:restriction endonuclease subunit S [Streptomyces sp. NPDC087538]|uniref:restriction endonuclease subunit S n=1 Tax=Streptomyces sp. NPDC087538 TaxID=3365797 RepID=UPI0038305771